MNNRASGKQVVLKLLVAAFISTATLGANPPSPQSNTNETDALVRQLTEKFTEADKKGVVVMDLEPAVGLTPFYVPVFMRVGWCCDRTWGGRSVAECGPSSAANSAGVLYPIPLCNRS